jgi:hypothetical protein
MKNIHVGAIAALLTLSALLCGCGTISSSFGRMSPDYANVPADALKTAASNIEKAVKKGNRELVLTNLDGLALDSPEINQAVRTRAARAELIGKLLATGFAVEQKDGLISVMRSREYKKATTSDERDRNALLVMSENANRWSMYEGMVKLSNLAPRALSTVQDAFYRARVELLESGQKYQDDSGQTVVKP